MKCRSIIHVSSIAQNIIYLDMNELKNKCIPVINKPRILVHFCVEKVQIHFKYYYSFMIERKGKYIN